jgi:hypothetical protein
MMTEEITQQRTFISQPCEDNSIDAAAYKSELIKVLQGAEASIKQEKFMTHEELDTEYYS